MNCPTCVSISILEQCNLHRPVNTTVNTTVCLPEEHLVVQALIPAVSSLFTCLFCIQVDEVCLGLAHSIRKVKLEFHTV